MIEFEVKYEIPGVKNYLYTKEELESFSTERLVSFIHHNHLYRRDVHMMSPNFYNNLHRGIIEVEADWSGDNTLNAYYWANEEELREILKTRPNIPNKQQKKRMLKMVIAENKVKTKRNLKYRNK